MDERVVDCIGLYCPVPIAQAAEALQEAAEGEVVTVLADDPGVENDFPNWCRVTGHTLVSMEKGNDGYIIKIKKKGR